MPLGFISDYVDRVTTRLLAWGWFYAIPINNYPYFRKYQNKAEKAISSWVRLFS